MVFWESISFTYEQDTKAYSEVWNMSYADKIDP